MKITIVQGAFLPIPPLMGGAVEKVWFALGAEFASRGHEVTHISRAYPGLEDRETINGVTHVRVPGYETPLSGVKLKLMDLLYALKVLRVLPKADIIITNTFFMPILLRGRSACGAIYVHVARFPKGQMGLYRHAQRLHTVSNVVGDAIKKQSPQVASRVKVIPYPLPYASKADAVVADRKKWILYVGRVHPEKGIELLLNAFGRLIKDDSVDYNLVVVGPWQMEMGGGGDKYYQRLRECSADFADRVTWVGPVFNENELSSYFKRAEIFVYPSLAETGETFGLAPLEAMAYGCVPVVSSLECFQDFITDGVNGFVFNHRLADPVTALCDSLRRSIETDDIDELRRQCAVTATKHSIPSIASRFIEDFESLRETGKNG